MKRQLIAIGTEVTIGPQNEDGAEGFVEAVFVYRNFVQYVVTWWQDGIKRVETVEEREIHVGDYATKEDPVNVWVEDDNYAGF